MIDWVGNFQKFIFQLMKDRGISSVAELAKLTNIPSTSCRKMCKGPKKGTTIPNVLKFAEFVNCYIDEILLGRKPINNKIPQFRKLTKKEISFNFRKLVVNVLKAMKSTHTQLSIELKGTEDGLRSFMKGTTEMVETSMF